MIFLFIYLGIGFLWSVLSMIKAKKFSLKGMLVMTTLWPLVLGAIIGFSVLMGMAGK